MVPVKFDVDDAQVIANGTIVLVDGGSKFSLYLAELKFTFNFHKSEENRVDVSGDPNTHVIMDMHGFLNPFGTAWKGNIGGTEDLDVFLALFVHGIPTERAARAVSYTLTQRGSGA